MNSFWYSAELFRDPVQEREIKAPNAGLPSMFVENVAPTRSEVAQPQQKTHHPSDSEYSYAKKVSALGCGTYTGGCPNNFFPSTGATRLK